jgi:hypothetical protein
MILELSFETVAVVDDKVHDLANKPRKYQTDYG